MMYIIKSYYRDFILGIKSLIKWLPIIWKDRDWDSMYTINIFLQKMKFQVEHMKLYSNEVEETLNPKIKEMENLVSLLQKIRDEDANYESPELLRVEQKWGKSDYHFVPTEDENLFKLIDKLEETLTESQIEERKKDTIKALGNAQKNRKADIEKAMKIFIENYQDWWN